MMSDIQPDNLTKTSSPSETPSTTSLQTNMEEQEYLNLIKDILDNGVEAHTRTGISTKSLFAKQLRFSLRYGQFPLLTTKRMFLRGIIEELLWFISGSTNNNDLKDKGIHIWDGNSSRDFLDSRGLMHYEEGDIGPTYGFSFRHFGADYRGCHHNYINQGFDQVEYILNEIRHNPTSRRLLINLWNPAALNEVALPPCAMMYQFNVVGDELSCQLYIRSSDTMLGLPWNIATGALMTHIMAHVTGLNPGDLIITTGNSHIYTNHIEGAKTQIARLPGGFPRLRINREILDIYSLEYKDFELVGYVSQKSIKMDMAV